ncbi:hypothetical protein QYM36_014573, partial [Artemia franciscana]
IQIKISLFKMSLTDSCPNSPNSAVISNEKSKRYDRQLRLWGDHGQAALELSHVCLINATALGTEILKSLVQPGIGGFTIIDWESVTEEDVGNNFFLTVDQIGQNRGQAATNLILELNPDVNGKCIDEQLTSILASPDASGMFKRFNIVIANGLNEKLLSQLSSYLWDLSIPLIICRSYGLVGHIRIQIKEHCVIESHPDSSLDDLRLDRPFPGLVKYMNEQNIETMDKATFTHTPQLVFLYKALERWRQDKGDGLPMSRMEKAEFKANLEESLRKKLSSYSNGEYSDAENIDECLKAVNTALVPTKIPSNIVELFSDEACQKLETPSKFWIMVRALKDFVNKEGMKALPVRGSLPDMHSDSERYVSLQNTYRHQATLDADAVYKHVLRILDERGWSHNLVTEADVRFFSKNAHALRLQRGTSYAAEIALKTDVQTLGCLLEDPDSDAVFYVLLRAADRFETEYGSYPGSLEVDVDVGRLKCVLVRLLSEWGLSSVSIKDEYIHEFCRYGASEIHSVAAFVGGCAAQEVIKIVTHQYVPVDNTIIYNAMHQTILSLKM